MTDLVIVLRKLGRLASTVWLGVGLVVAAAAKSGITVATVRCERVFRMSSLPLTGYALPAALAPLAKAKPSRSITEQNVTVANDNALPMLSAGQIARRYGWSRSRAGRLLDGAQRLTLADCVALGRGRRAA